MHPVNWQVFGLHLAVGSRKVSKRSIRNGCVSVVVVWENLFYKIFAYTANVSLFYKTLEYLHINCTCTCNYSGDSIYTLYINILSIKMVLFPINVAVFPYCPIHVVTFNLISIWYQIIFKREEESLACSLLNIICYQN